MYAGCADGGVTYNRVMVHLIGLVEALELGRVCTTPHYGMRKNRREHSRMLVSSCIFLLDIVDDILS